jgi:hypothetical protein
VFPVLAVDSLVWIAALSVLSVIVLLLIVIAPWKRVRAERPLDPEIETRLLLGEDPDEIDRDIASRQQGGAPVAEFRRDDDRS